MTDVREAELLAEIKTLNERLARMEALEKENALLRQKIDLMIRKLFGAQSEKLDPAQLLLLLQGFDDALACRNHWRSALSCEIREDENAD